uniref:Uncharacterized protein n=1 Tax=Scleropages formosus TaxID=113540 RepID=A0A8C9WAA5_SCLFO
MRISDPVSPDAALDTDGVIQPAPLQCLLEDRSFFFFFLMHFGAAFLLLHCVFVIASDTSRSQWPMRTLILGNIFFCVSAKGETLIHRVCKRNQVETLLHILSLPGTDVNVKDHAGWTPLHEACNHGSSECVQALLQHCPTLNLDIQVGGVSPLHDALLNGHIHIAKMLLQYAGSPLLRQRNTSGRTPLEVVSSPSLREELWIWAREGDSAQGKASGAHIRDPPFLEAAACLLRCLLLSYALVRDVPSYEAMATPPDPTPRLARAVAAHTSRRVTADWGDPLLVRLAEDVETLLGVGSCLRATRAALRCCQGPHARLLLLQLEELERTCRQGELTLNIVKNVSWQGIETPSSV